MLVLLTTALVSGGVSGAGPAAQTKSSAAVAAPSTRPSRATKPLGATATTARYTLDNGLRVLLAPMQGSSRVAVTVAYAAGWRDEPADRPGLAHLAEHMTFRRSAHADGLDVWRWLEQMGGWTNGATLADGTMYLTEGPSHVLEPILWRERERMAFTTPALREKELDVEINVVIQELLQRDRLDVRRHRYELQAFFGAQHPLIRAADEADQVDDHTIEDVRWFLSRYYRPDNAVVVIAGGFDADAARGWVDEYLGTLAAAYPRRTPAPGPAPQLRAPELSIFHSTYERLVSVVWLRPAATPWSASALLERIIQARLDHQAVKPLCQGLATYFYRYRYEESLTIAASPSADVEVRDVEAALRRGVATALRSPVTASELREARADLKLALLDLATDTARYAATSAQALLVGEPATIAERARALERVTTATLSAVAAQLAGERPLISRVFHKEDAYDEVVVRRHARAGD